MAEKSVVELIEDWQTGAAYIIGSVLVGGALGLFLRSQGPDYLGLGGLLVGTILAFLFFSYVRYGR